MLFPLLQIEFLFLQTTLFFLQIQCLIIRRLVTGHRGVVEGLNTTGV